MYTTFKRTIALLCFSLVFACNGEEVVSESTANENLLVGLLSGQALSTSFLTEFNGQWNVGFTYDSQGQLTGVPGGRLIIATNPDGSGSIISSSASGSSDDTTYRIISFDRAKRQLFYQNTPGPNNFGPSTYGRIDFSPISTTGCELGATRCFYYCEIIFGQTSLANVLASTATSNADTATTDGCGGFTFNRALLRTENGTWTGL